jgi:hypothetical protein
MATYNYTRERLAEGDHINEWDIDNPDRVDGGLDQIHLATEITAAIPGKILDVPGIICNGSSCTIAFTEALTAGEETTLTTIVNNHKNNVGGG